MLVGTGITGTGIPVWEWLGQGKAPGTQHRTDVTMKRVQCKRFGLKNEGLVHVKASGVGRRCCWGEDRLETNREETRLAQGCCKVLMQVSDTK